MFLDVIFNQQSGRYGSNNAAVQIEKTSISANPCAADGFSH
jgi:hypothetical protein